VPILGGSWVKLNTDLVAGRNVGSFQLSPDSSRAVYMADQDTGGVYELYSVPIGGGSVATKLNTPLAAGRNVDSFQISPDSGRVVYEADQQTANVLELYSVSIGGPAASGVKLNGNLVANGNVGSFQISPINKIVIYISDQNTDEVFELYMTLNYIYYLPLILK
jgi:hypothetical protein